MTVRHRQEHGPRAVLLALRRPAAAPGRARDPPQARSHAYARELRRAAPAAGAIDSGMQVVIAALVVSFAYFATAFRAELPTLPRVVLYGRMGSKPTARKIMGSLLGVAALVFAAYYAYGNLR